METQYRMQQTSGPQKDRVEIDLRCLCRHLLSKWKRILAGAVIGAVIGGAVGGLNVYSYYTKPAFNDEELEAMKEQLTDYELTEADQIYAQYQEYVRGVEILQTYNNQSFIMQIKPETAVGYNVQYLVLTDLGNASSAFSSAILSREDYQKIASLMNTDTTKVRSCVSIGSSGTRDSTEYDLERTDRLAGKVAEEYKLLLTVSVLSPDEETCSRMVEIVEEAMERKAEHLRALDVKIEIEKVDSTYNEDSTNSVLSMQQGAVSDYVSMLNTKNTYLENVVSKLTGNQKDYIDLLRTRDEPDNREKASWKKPMAIGFVAGAFLVICVLCALYILEDLVRSEGDVEAMAGMPVMQDDLGDPDKLEMFISELSAIAGREGIRRIYAATETLSGMGSEVAETIRGRLPEIAVESGDLKLDPENMKKVLSSEAVVILPVTDVTKRGTLKDFLDVCSRHGIRIAGLATVGG